MLLLLRFLPFIAGAVNLALFAWQPRLPNAYPWIVVWAPALILGTGLLIAQRRMRPGEAFEKLLPPAIAVTSFGYSLLLMEGLWVSVALPLLAGGVTFVALELLFLLIYRPTRYPVNGMSHLNLSLVPVAILFAQFASVGLTVFVHASRVIPVAVMAAVTALLFHVTSHVEATAEHRRRWTALGAWIGVHIGLLGIFLPVNLVFHGSLAAVVAAFALRTRRYGIAPRLAPRFVVAEIIVAAALLIAMATTARWA
ncbi:MAG TPA: hypothetical protein VN397_04190 [Candidatus Methylomirabilis sp.]|nr:hypothetical protein [Candidatus Methylomirabilis sp.]